MFGKNNKRFSSDFLYKPNFKSYKVEYILEAKNEALLSFLAKKEKITIEQFQNKLKELEANNYKTPIELSVFGINNWSQYVDLSTGLIIGWDNNLKRMGEQFNHDCYLLYDKNTFDSPKLSGNSMYNTVFNVGINSVSYRNSSGSKETIFRFEPFKFTRELIRLEASQSGMHKYLFKDIPKNWEQVFNECGIKYTSYYLKDESISKELKVLDCDYEYEFKTAGLKFYDQLVDEHVFENELFEMRYRIEFFEPIVHFNFDFGNNSIK